MMEGMKKSKQAGWKPTREMKETIEDRKSHVGAAPGRKEFD